MVLHLSIIFCFNAKILRTLVISKNSLVQQNQCLIVASIILYPLLIMKIFHYLIEALNTLCFINKEASKK